MTPLNAVRACYGASELLFPDLISGRLAGQPLDRGFRLAARALGGRQLVQAAVAETTPTHRTLLAGASIDGLHALSMLGLAVVAPRWRRLALAETLVATSFGIAGALSAATRDPIRAPGRSRPST